MYLYVCKSKSLSIFRFLGFYSHHWTADGLHQSPCGLTTLIGLILIERTLNMKYVIVIIICFGHFCVFVVTRNSTSLV